MSPSKAQADEAERTLTSNNGF